MYPDLPNLEHYLAQFLKPTRIPDQLKMQTMRTLCEFFGHPENSCPCFHVAGSKGKSTIAHGISAVLRGQGYTTGVFTSPHVYHFAERTSTGTGPFPPAIYASAERELIAGVDKLLSTHQLSKDLITWFMLVTVFAMLVFRNAKVDYAIYEVGMGGQSDVTNVVTPEVVAMGPIELEHTKYLGNTLAEIAAHKAGIFKPNVPIVSVPQSPTVRAVFKKQATKNHQKVHYITSISEYQMLDARLSATAVRQMLPTLDLKNATLAALHTNLPGRYELIKNTHGLPYLLLDGAHTKNSIKALLRRMKKDGIRGNLIFDTHASSNQIPALATLIINSGLFEKIYYSRSETAFHSPTANHQPELFFCLDRRAMIETAIADSSASHTPLIAFGSFYLLGDVKNAL